jgi:hypothetical protein
MFKKIHLSISAIAPEEIVKTESDADMHCIFLAM